ncbi:MAG: hypothetical protein ACRC9N_11285 [Aeromonas sp.]
MKKLINIELVNNGDAPVFCKYDNEVFEQFAFLEFDPTGHDVTLIADYEQGSGKGVNLDVLNSSVYRFGINPRTSKRALLALETDEELFTLLSNIKNNYSFEWNGNDFSGSFGDVFFERDWLEKINRYLQSVLVDSLVWFADEYLAELDLIEELKNFGCCLSLQEFSYEIGQSADKPLEGDINNAVSAQLEIDIAHFIRTEYEPNETVRSAALMLSVFNPIEYSYLLSDYDSEFHPQED